jgi:NCAIR mutase (PurE)-related protein
VDEAALRRLLDDVSAGAMHPDDAIAALRRLPFADVGDALVDHHRSLRQGLGEAIYGPGKTPAQCIAIVDELLTHGSGPIVLSRATPAQVDAMAAALPADVRTDHGSWSTLVWRPMPAGSRVGNVAVVSAGTADLPVADECRAVLAAHGVDALRLNDVGVAGLHRLLGHLDALQAADVCVVVAGMEGALASVLGGLTGAPVVAVPTSVGYGAALEGVTALLSMLSSCASGVTVVGIDNGFGAAWAVLRLLATGARLRVTESGGPSAPERGALEQDDAQ